jgi:hypothetical protein
MPQQPKTGGAISLESQVATKTIVWRPKKAKSVVQHLLLVFFTGIYSTSKKAKSV